MGQSLSISNKPAPNFGNSAIPTLNNSKPASGVICEFRSSHLQSQASGVCVRIDAHRRRVELAQNLDSLERLLNYLEKEGLIEDDEYYFVRVGKLRKQRTLRQLLNEAQSDNLSPQQAEIRQKKIKSAILAQLVAEKKEKVDTLLSELKSIQLNKNLSDQQKKEALFNVINKAKVQGLISDLQQNSLLELLNSDDGFKKAFYSLNSALTDISVELARKQRIYLNNVEFLGYRFSSPKNSNTEVPLSVFFAEPFVKSFKPDSSNNTSVITYVINNLNAPDLHKKYTELLAQLLEELSQYRQRAYKQEKEEQIKEEEALKREELNKIREVFREILGEIRGVRISDIQVTLKSLEDLPRYAIVQIIMDLVKAFGSTSSQPEEPPTTTKLS